MAISRYKDLGKIKNSDPDYRKQYLKRYQDRSAITHYETQMLEYPTIEEIKSLEFANHIWNMGDRYYKLAQHFYGDSAHWWIIAWFNKKPTEGHINFGDLIYVPLPLERVISYYGV